MKTRTVSGVLGALAAVTLVTAAFGDEVPIQPVDDGTSVKGLVYARAFEVDEPFTYDWTADREQFQSGYVLVFDVDPELAQPRQGWSPVLYVGRYPAQQTNVGVESGRMVVVVPGAVDLARDLVFFGSYELPERVDETRGLAELEAAREIGIEPLGEAAVAGALAEGGPTVQLATIAGVDGLIADALELYSPGETGLIEIYRLTPVN